MMKINISLFSLETNCKSDSRFNFESPPERPDYIQLSGAS